MNQNARNEVDRRRALPSVNALLELPEVRRLLAQAPRVTVVSAVRGALDDARATNDGTMSADQQNWAAIIEQRFALLIRPSLRPVINATGVILHTNLGRAPLADVAIDAISSVARGYSNLEYDLDEGSRGSRYSHCVGLLRELTGADDALVVNNGAAALVLALNTLAQGRGAVISRGELIEIGGSFRIPEIMERSGARLVEVGTTNRTHLEDYQRALGSIEGVAVIVKVHRSNFAIEGFVAEARVGDLARLAERTGIPIVHDLGSGLLIPLDSLGLTGEPTAREALTEGATLVTMSGDKLLGGPQCGIVVGDRSTIAALRGNPLTRAVRVDKLTLAALEATLALYRDPPRALREIPILAMLGATTNELRRRAESIRATLAAAVKTEIRLSEASVGGGAFPTARIPSIALTFPENARAIEQRLRLGDPAVIGRVADEQLLIDLRTVASREDGALAQVLGKAVAPAP